MTYNAWPDPIQLRESRAALMARAWRSVRDIFAARLPERLACLDAPAFATEETRLNLLHPEFVQWYFALVDKLEDVPTPALVAVADRLPAVVEAVTESRRRAQADAACIGAPVDTDHTGTDITSLLDRMQEDVEVMLQGFRPEVRFLTRLDGGQKQALRDGFGVIERIWPEAYAELAVTLDRIHVFESACAMSLTFTDFQHHGAISIRKDDLERNDPVHVGEELIHEGGHTLLNTIAAVTPLFTNDPGARYSSPLRKDPRPMFGLFHQMFVLSRIVQYHRLWHARTGEVRPELAKTQRELDEGLDLVVRHAELTPAGRDIVDAIVHLSAGARRVA